MDVAQEKFFYRLIDLRPDEEDFIRRFIDNQCHPVIRGLNYDFLTLFTSTNKLKASLDESERPNREEYASKIRDLEVRLMEDAHGKMEGLGETLVCVNNFDDFKNLTVDDKYFEAVMFLCVQYFRTNKAKKNALRSFEGGKLEAFAKKSWNIFVYILSTILAHNISRDPRLRFTYYSNSTGTSFITSDQPIFNLLGETLDQNRDVAGLEFFYPLGPTAAIKIHFNEQVEQFNEVRIDQAAIDNLNDRLYQNADYFVFGDSKTQLEQFASKNTAQ